MRLFSLAAASIFLTPALLLAQHLSSPALTAGISTHNTSSAVPAVSPSMRSVHSGLPASPSSSSPSTSAHMNGAPGGTRATKTQALTTCPAGNVSSGGHCSVATPSIASKPHCAGFTGRSAILASQLTQIREDIRSACSRDPASADCRTLKQSRVCSCWSIKLC